MNEIIKKTEAKWLDILFRECTCRFAPIHLPSHDQWHHLRVWHFAKILIQTLHTEGISISDKDVEETIIAVFFHDQGMSRTMAKEHGFMSRQFCIDYFARNKSNNYIPSENLLQAIEHHDMKDYENTLPIEKFELQKLLNIADDLDAFSYTGVYRYLEIYLMRNIAIELLPKMILDNLELRYKYLCQSFVYRKTFLAEQYNRFVIAKKFFENLAIQISENIDLSAEIDGPIGVVKIIRDEIIRMKVLPDKVRVLLNSCNEDDYCRLFFLKLHREYKLMT